MTKETGGEARVEMHLQMAWKAPDFDGARIELDAALEALNDVSPENRRSITAIAWIDYATLAEKFGEFDVAAGFNARLLADDPEDLAANLTQMTLYRRMERPAEVSESLLKCGELAEQKHDIAVLSTLATLGYLPLAEIARAQRIDESIQYWEGVVRLLSPPDSPTRRGTLQYGLGKLYGYKADMQSGMDRRGSLARAIQAFETALSVFTADQYPENHQVVLRRLKEAKQRIDSPQP